MEKMLQQFLANNVYDSTTVEGFWNARQTAYMKWIAVGAAAAKSEPTTYRDKYVYHNESSI